MTLLETLHEQFGHLPGVRFEPGQGGLLCLRIANAHAEAEIYLHGAHVTQFQPADESPVLFVSANSEFVEGKPIRGGVPIIFPWFGPREGTELHGIVRLMNWDVAEVRQADGETIVALQLDSDSQPHPNWPGRCALRYEVSVGRALRLTLRVENRGEEPFTFEEALHTYFAVGDARRIGISGLQCREFIDKTDNFARKTQSDELLRLNGETDSVYFDAGTRCVIEDEANARRIAVAKSHSATTVVWNPWIAKAATMPDFGDDEWPQMVCVETCNALDGAITLAPGGSHEMTAVIEVER